MTHSEFNRFLRLVPTLSLEELRQLRKALNALSVGEHNETPEEMDQRIQRELYAEGILSEIKPPVSGLKGHRNRKLLKIKGKPVSQTLIEERR